MSLESGPGLHFSLANLNYHSAWKYTTKSDCLWTKWKTSCLDIETFTKQLGQKKSPISKKTTTTKSPQNKKRLTPNEVSDIIRTKLIKTKSKLFPIAETQFEVRTTHSTKIDTLSFPLLTCESWMFVKENLAKKNTKKKQNKTKNAQNFIFSLSFLTKKKSTKKCQWSTNVFAEIAI